MCMQYSMLLLLVADYNLKVDCDSLSMYYDIKKKTDSDAVGKDDSE